MSDTDSGDTKQEVRGTRVEIVLERDDDGAPIDTITREVPRELTTKAQYRKKSKQNHVWDWNGTIRLDLSESGLEGDKAGIIDIKYIEGGVFLPPESDGNGCDVGADTDQ